MFRDILKNFLSLKEISQVELASLTNDTQQAINGFLSKKGNVQAKTKRKFFDALDGFEDYYLEQERNPNKQDFVKEKNLYDFSVEELTGHFFENMDKPEFKNNSSFKMLKHILEKKSPTRKE